MTRVAQRVALLLLVYSGTHAYHHAAPRLRALSYAGTCSPIAPARACAPLPPQQRGRAAVMADAAALAAEGDGEGGKRGWRSALPTRAEAKKVVPLGVMFFFILFSYTILRDTKVPHAPARALSHARTC